MAVRIRLQRKGQKKRPIYRVVVQDSRVARGGKVIEYLGRYNPNIEPKLFEVNEEKLQEWIKKGALPTNTIARLLKKIGDTKEVKKETKTSAKKETAPKVVKEEKPKKKAQPKTEAKKAEKVAEKE